MEDFDLGLDEEWAGDEEEEEQEPEKKRRKLPPLVDLLTIVMLAATACLIGVYGLLIINPHLPFNPFPPPTLVPLAPTLTPSLTPTDTPTPGVPTWTPTLTPSATLTPTPRPPTKTPTPTPTFKWPDTAIPSATPTETPIATRSPWPFTYELSFITPQYGCGWTGVAGKVQDLDGNPLAGYPVHIWGAGIDIVVTAGADARYNTIYGSPAAWEQFFDTSPKPMQVRVQLHDPYRDDHPPVSEEVVLDFPGYCGGALGYVVFTMNHEY